MYKEFIIDDYVIVNNKKFKLNLNVYRNAHHFILNTAKINFKENLIADYPEIIDITATKAILDYTIIPNDNRMFDTFNTISIVDKFFCDALVQSGCLPEDNYKHVSYGQIRVSDIEKTNKCKKILISCTFL